MVNFQKLIRFANNYVEEISNIDSLISNLWDGSPPQSENQTENQIQIQEIPEYTRLAKSPNQDVTQKSYEILNQIHFQPIGTTVPFTINGINYLAKLETHSPSPTIPQPHPGISLFIQNNQPTTPTLSERSKAKIAELQPPEFQQQITKLLLIGLANNLRPEIVEGYRSQTRQDELYEQGRTKPGNIVTKTRNSMHTKRMAVDIAQLDENGNITYNATPGFWEEMGSIGRSLGLNWGGDWTSFKDLPHFQYVQK